jgi:hypothetical protein
MPTAKLELFGSAAAADDPWLFKRNPVVAGFLVNDIECARNELARTPGVELLGQLRVIAGGYASPRGSRARLPTVRSQISGAAQIARTGGVLGRWSVGLRNPKRRSKLPDRM